MHSFELVTALAALPDALTGEARVETTNELVKQFRNHMDEMYAPGLSPYTQLVIWNQACNEGLEGGYLEVEEKYRHYASFALSLPNIQ